MVNAFHGRQTVDQGIHGLAAFEYADEAARLAAGPFETYDRNKVARQLDDDSFWILVDETGPTWQSIGTAASLIDRISVMPGVISGGILSVNGGDPATFDISSGIGYIVDFWTDPLNPVVSEVTLGGTGLAVTNLATQSATYILVDDTSTVIQQGISPTAEERRRYLYLGQLGHSNNTTIGTAVPTPSYAYSIRHDYEDLTEAIGTINNGVFVIPNGTNLNINRSDGYLFFRDSNVDNNARDPNNVAITSQAPLTFRLRTQTGNGSTSTILDVGNYDSAGIVTAIAGTQYQNFRVYQIPSGNTVIQYGQNLYPNIDDAVDALGTESFSVLSSLVESAALIGVITASSTAVDLSNTSQARFFSVSKFGELTSSAGGSAVTSHSLLTGLGNDDHTQYLLVDGSRAMSGDLDMDGYDIVSVGLVDGVDVSLHASRHETGGADPLDGYQIDLVYSPISYLPPINDIIGEHIARIDEALTGAIGTGDVNGPASSLDNAIARFDGSTGKLIQNSGVTLEDNGNILFSDTLSAALLRQLDTTAAFASNFQIYAQSSTGGGSVGGDLILASGSGTSASGDIELTVGSSVALALNDNTVSTLSAAGDGYLVAYNQSENAVEYIDPITVGVTDHGGLTGLGDDDHTQYLLVSGTRPMSGNLDMGSNDIVSVGLVDGVDVSAHSTRHENGGADEINVGGLSGLLADPQTPLAHASTHESGGTDALDGYQIDLGYSPVNYLAPTNDIIGEHIARIDEALAGAVSTGDVNGPASSTDNAITRFDGVTGKLIQNSLVTISDTGSITLDATVTSPIISQADDATPATAGDRLTVQAQNMTGGTTVGGELWLTSGSGTTDGDVVILTGGNLAMLFDEETATSFAAAEDGYVVTYNAVNNAVEYSPPTETKRIVTVDFALTEDAFNFSPYFFTWRSTGSDSTTGKRSTSASGMSTPNACNPYIVPFDATITRAILVVRGVGVQNGSVTYPVSYRADLLDVGFTGNTKIADVDFSISNSFTVGTFSVGNTNFRGGMSMNLDVDEGDTLGLQFNHGVGASIAGQTRMAFVTFVLEER